MDDIRGYVAFAMGPTGYIGHVAFAMGPTGYIARLGTDRTWRVEPKLPPDLRGVVVRDVLRAAVDAYRGPSDGPFGPGALRAVAERLKGTAHVIGRPDPDPGTIY